MQQVILKVKEEVLRAVVVRGVEVKKGLGEVRLEEVRVEVRMEEGVGEMAVGAEREMEEGKMVEEARL